LELDVRIDTHAHVILPDTMGKAGKYGPEIVTYDGGRASLRVGPYESRVGGDKGMTAAEFERLGDPRTRISQLDELGIDMMGISISPLFYLYWAEDDIRTPFVSLQNDALSKYCAEAPSRLWWMATLPLPNIEASLAEIRRAVDLGAKGINVGTGDFDGVDLDDQRLWPVYQELEAHNLPLFIHPYPLTMASGAEDRYNLSWSVGYNYQETVAYAHLILGGVFDDFPKLKVLITHGGGFAPYQVGRIEEARRRQPDVRAKKPVTEYGENIFFEILVHDLAARKFLVDFAGVDQLVVGDNFGGWDAANGFKMLDELELNPVDHEKISSGNAIKLFNLEPR
jgi:aminocarboxymuconate-semialdehyde decarboxylase